MSSKSIRMALLMSAFALIPSALRAQPATEITAPKQASIPEPSNSTLDMPIEDIAAALGGGAILDKDFPGLRTHAMYGFFKAMTLNQIAAMSHRQITPDMLAQARSDLSVIPLKRVAGSVLPADVEDLPPSPPGDQASLSDSVPK